ncbi:hypothetical protein N799_07460 [Lysobacter arseniciresistens ZS79]|uniref:Barstar (barnase inhibitor) domain-containing protein n=1 Tax=Lysobacter arseniciresistens ZS79 TaxID=913325 RepID=A0A0A0ET65_9GAMM|nr:barstar family protein [Lysobacter arseniciresistens]KGM53410.1 hypothetical protein N799_07460 [Lysobacter arseniciresistens ZS79]
MSAIDLRALLADPLQAGAYFVDERDTAAMAQAGTALDLGVARIDLAGCVDKADLLARLGLGLQLPSWFGGNWDALADSLGDLSWWQVPGYLLLLENAGGLRDADAESFAMLLAILNETADDWRERNVAFWALLPLPEATLQQLDG